MSSLRPHREALTLCAYCPSLCQHACPVATAEGSRTVTPWALMSLVHHVAEGAVRLTDEVAETLYHCTGCRACTEFCNHDNDVERVIMAARAHAVERGRTPLPRRRFAHELEDLTLDPWWREWGRSAERFRVEPAVLLLPGHHCLLEDAAPVRSVLELCERVDEDELACGDASLLDPGYELWAGGFLQEFAKRAKEVAKAIGQAGHVVVMSAEALYTLRDLYPTVGVTLEAELLHVSEFILPFMAGAVVDRVEGRVVYHDSCHLARHLDTVDVPRELLRRVLVDPPVELFHREAGTVCCGGTGCLPQTAPATTAGMAADVIAAAVRSGAERLVTFASECVPGLRAAAGDALRVDHAVTLVDEAVRDDGV